MAGWCNNDHHFAPHEAFRPDEEAVVWWAALLYYMLVFSPLTRGCTAQVLLPVEVDDLFPAHAGMHRASPLVPFFLFFDNGSPIFFSAFGATAKASRQSAVSDLRAEITISAAAIKFDERPGTPGQSPPSSVRV